MERWPACRAEASYDAADELVLVSRGCGAQIVELVRPIAALPVARWAPGGEPSSGGGLDDAAAIEHPIEHPIEHAIGHAVERERAQPRR